MDHSRDFILIFASNTTSVDLNKQKKTVKWESISSYVLTFFLTLRIISPTLIPEFDAGVSKLTEKLIKFGESEKCIFNDSRI